jgi:geranylgeranyl diphosphate synthase type II
LERIIMDVATYLKHHQALVDQALKNSLPPLGTRPEILHEAMHYCALNGGKRIRPILCVTAAETFGADTSQALGPAVAIELYHCSTLIHDDLPCMDNDDLRRGKPTCHVKYGAANAVLTGDAMMIQAFYLLAEYGNSALSLELASSAGSMGVIAGQVEDLAAEDKSPSADLVEYIHMNKTAILIRAALRMGAIIGNAEETDFNYLSQFGEKIGLAFQIADDILDETSTDDILGKPAGSDAEKNKLTYPAVHGMTAATDRVRELTDEAIAALDPISRNTGDLQAIAEYLVNRKY